MSHTLKGHLFTEVVLEAFKLNGALVVQGDRIASRHGLSSARWKILGALINSKNPLTVPQIARSMGQTRQSVQRLVEAMHINGLLELFHNPNHKRAKLIALSKKGTKIYFEIMEDQIPWANNNAAHLDKKDLEKTLLTLKKISQLF